MTNRMGLLKPFEGHQRGGAVHHDDAREDEQERAVNSNLSALSFRAIYIKTRKSRSKGKTTFGFYLLTLVLTSLLPYEILSAPETTGAPRID